ncbi:MAG TPA: type VI secretion system tip protein VgrG [Luteimonas sp.]
MPYTTSRRMFLLSTPLGEDALLIQQFEGSEGISRLFEFRLLMLSEDDSVAAGDLVGKRVTLRIETAEGERYWLGMVSAFERVGRVPDPAGSEAEMTSYRCEVVPWLWFLTLHKDTRVFQEQSVPEIIEALLGEFEFKDYEVSCKDKHPKRTYCTQYNETVFDFISRLMEEEGIFYFFRHPADGHGAETMVFSDHKDIHPALDPDTIRMDQAGSVDEADTVATLLHRQHMRSGKVTLRDFNFERPTDRMEVSVDSLVRIGDNAKYEVYDYPGLYAQRNDGEEAARRIMEIEEARHEILDGTGNVRALVPGHRFTLADHPQDALNEEYVVTSVRHSGSNNLGNDGGPSSYGNSFTCIPSRVQYREPRRTPRPHVAGVQTAIVTGPRGNEIYIDDYGRVKVQFHWDRQGTYDDKSSCWVRVAQGHAGAKWGSFMPPRIGEEVLVAFEHGDPDRPYVIGSLYNADNMPPYPPGEATKSTFKSNSSKGGGGFNELRFEDKAGSEEIFMHAQKDLQTRVQKNASATIGANKQLTVGGNRSDHVGGEQHIVVDKHNFVDVKQDSHLNIGMNAAIATGMNLHVASGTDTCLDAGTKVHVKAGVNLVLEAGVMISLKVGGSSITIGPAGVTLDGPLVRINCGGSPLAAMKGEKPDKAKKAGEAIAGKAGKISNPGQQTQAKALRRAAAQAQPFCAECQAARAALAAMGR